MPQALVLLWGLSALLLGRLHRHKTHGRAANRLTARFRVNRIPARQRGRAWEAATTAAAAKAAANNS